MVWGLAIPEGKTALMLGGVGLVLVALMVLNFSNTAYKARVAPNESNRLGLGMILASLAVMLAFVGGFLLGVGATWGG
jgi:hypothetical protein